MTELDKYHKELVERTKDFFKHKPLSANDIWVKDPLDKSQNRITDSQQAKEYISDLVKRVSNQSQARIQELEKQLATTKNTSSIVIMAPRYKGKKMTDPAAIQKEMNILYKMYQTASNRFNELSNEMFG